jgi:hypothetical protein
MMKMCMTILLASPFLASCSKTPSSAPRTVESRAVRTVAQEVSPPMIELEEVVIIGKRIPNNEGPSPVRRTVAAANR